MTDVFISYSRRDLQFVRKLSKALESRELSAWVDWEGIAPTATWLAEIQRAIESADHFVFVISPDSVASEICGLELTHAVELHKRLVPVRFRPVEPDALPVPLRETQWLEITASEPFDSAMERLVTAIRTDPASVRQHTRLLTEAIEWQSRRRERSLLLRGQDLADAEQWLRVDAQHPAPTELHREFIAKSRRAAILLHRLFVGVGIAVALALVVLGGYYLRERGIARERGLVALSRAAANQALAIQERAFDLALLLAAEAHAISPTVEADGALQRILLSKPRLEQILPAGSNAVGIGFNRDGRRLAAGFGDGSVRVWSHEKPGKEYELAKIGAASACAFNADLSLVAAGGGQQKAIMLRRLPAGESFSFASINNTSELMELRFSPDGRFLGSANGTQQDGVSVWDMSSKRISGNALTDDGGLAAVGFSPDGRMVAAAGWSEHVSLWEVNSRQLLQQRKLQGGRTTWAVALTSGWLAAASGDIQIFDLSRPEDGPARILKTAGSEARSVAFDPKGRWLAAGSDGGIVQLWDLSRPESTAELLRFPGSYVDELAFSPNGRYLAAGGYNQPVRIYTTGSISRFGRLLGKQTQTVSAVCFSPDGKQAAAAGRDRVIDLWSFSENRHESLKGHVSDIGALAFTQDGSSLISADARVLPNAQGRVDVLRWDLRHSPVRLTSPTPGAVQVHGIWALALDLPMLRDTPWPVALDGSGKILVRHGPFATDAYGNGIARIEIVSAADGRVLKSLDTGFRNALTALALSPDGLLVAASATDGRCEVWRVGDGRLLLDARSSRSALCRAATFSRNGLRLAIAFDDEITVYDLRDGARRLAVMGGASSPIEAMALDHEGRRLATSDQASGWTLWDVAAARAVGGVFPAPAVICALAFSADGKQLLTGGREGRVIVWDIALEAWLERASRIAGRELTQAERKRFLLPSASSGSGPDPN